MGGELNSSLFRLSAFGDEIADELADQLALLRRLEIGYLELRGVWGKNVLHLTDAEVARIRQMCADQSIGVNALGSPVGKSPIDQPWEIERANLERIFAIAHQLGVTAVRVFSFYGPANASMDAAAWLQEAVVRLRAMAALAERDGIQLLLENESGIAGDTVAHCTLLLREVQSPALAFAWDPANFVHVGEAAPTTNGWASLGPRTQHVHIKDMVAATGEIVPAGAGDGEMMALLAHLNARGYDGFLALEPHLAFAGKSGGFSGEEGMAQAVQSLRVCMAAAGIAEMRPAWAGVERR